MGRGGVGAQGQSKNNIYIQKRTWSQCCRDTFRVRFWPLDSDSKNNSQSAAETGCHNQKCGLLTPSSPPPFPRTRPPLTQNLCSGGTLVLECIQNDTGVFQSSGFHIPNIMVAHIKWIKSRCRFIRWIRGSRLAPIGEMEASFLANILTQDCKQISLVEIDFSSKPPKYIYIYIFLNQCWEEREREKKKNLHEIIPSE